MIDKRSHIGGNCYTEKIEDIDIHKYGAHIFHTNDEKIWDYVNNLGDFNNYVNSPLAKANGKLYNLPFNMNTFYQVWGISDPNQVKEKISQDSKVYTNPKNLEEQAISLVGEDIYKLFIKGYTEKQWGMQCKDLPNSIIKRLPVRLTFDNNYFNDRFQGIPNNGYTSLFENLLQGIEVKLNTDYFDFIKNHELIFKKTIYTGPIDLYYDNIYGKLDYRSLRFEDEMLDTDNYQGNAVVNYTTHEEKFTRILEHKHFSKNNKSNKTIITREYPDKYDGKNEPYYPINNEKNMDIFKKYKEKSLLEKDVLFGGRLAEYRYYDMHQIIASALTLSKKIL